MDQNDRTTLSAGSGGAATATRTRWGRRSPGGLFWLALLLVPLLLALLATCAGRGGIQDDLTSRANAALEAQGIDGVGVSFDGRDGALQVPGGVDAAAAKKAVLGVDGVRTVDVQGGSGDGTRDKAAGAGAPSPYALAAAQGKLVVTAVVPGADDKAALLDAVKARAGDRQVVDKVRVKDGATGPDAAGVAALAATLADSPGTKADWDGDGLVLMGKVRSEQVKSAAGDAAAQLAPGKVQNLLTVGAADAGAGACDRLDLALARVQKRTKIQFAESSPELTASSQKAITEIAALLQKCSGAHVEVGGHTDNQGDPSTSVPLSQDRARAVRAALVEAGIAGDRISARGYGESRPIASNSTAAGQAANRRVEIKVK